jgi:cholinesterase
LNLWSKPQSGEKKKAVMAWIYGGGKIQHSCHASCNLMTVGLNIGNTNNPIYDGARLAAEQDVVVVSMKYDLIQSSEKWR